MINDVSHDGPSWMLRPLPARLLAKDVAKVLGFSENEVRFLMNHGHLKVIGNPDAKQTKWVSTAYLANIVTNENWLKRATELCYQANRRPNHAQKRLAA